MAEIDAYNEALQSGQYQKPGGLLGKYDNVRRFWEDEQLGLYLGPYLEHLVSRKRERAEGLRVFDIGCGGGDGFEFITSIDHSKALIADHNSRVMKPDTLELYRGIDINEGLLEQARDTYGKRQNMGFINSDFNSFDFSTEEAGDLHLANYGALSHNTDEQTIGLLSNIANHARDGALIVIDWLGRFSYEWQTLWTKDFEHNQWMDYAISYIYSDDEAEQPELTYFPLRIMGRQEVLDIYRQAKRKCGGVITLRKLADRSSFVGRHIDTAQYNPHCQPLRRLVNSLFEPNSGTNLEELLVHYVPREGFDEVNAYYQKLTEWWNYLITYTRTLLEGSTPPQVPPGTPAAVRRVLSTMKKVVSAASKTKIGTPRASLVEPQLGYCLRELEIGLQRGIGCGHGLVAIFEIVK
ncbi:class I SAM-dependent methyltransferase [Chloroflexota bacterium]